MSEQQKFMFYQPGRSKYRIDKTAEEGTYRLTRSCPLCGDAAVVVIPAQGLWDWEHGKFVQEAFPSLSPEEREIIITGTHPTCWEELMGRDEDDDEY